MANGGAVAQSDSGTVGGRAGVSGAGIAAALGHTPVAVILALAALIHIAIVVGSSLPRYRKLDFSTYYTACVAIREGKNPYRVDLLPISARLGLDSGEMNHISETPTFLAAFEPLTLIPPRPAHALWQLLNLVLLAASIWILLDADGGNGAGLTAVERWSVAALALLYPPVAQNLMFAQTQIVILFLLAIAMRALRRGNDAAAGAAIAIAGLLRAYPLLFFLYFAIRKRWRALRWGVIAAAAGIALTFAALGVERSLSWIGVLRWTTGQWQAARAFNVAAAGFVSRMFWYSCGENLSGTLDLLRWAAVFASQLFFVALTVIASMRADPDQRSEARVYGLWAATAVIISPIAWPHYLVLMLIPFLTLAAQTRMSAQPGHAGWMAAANFLLIGIWLEVWAGPVMFATQHHDVPLAVLMAIGEFGFVAAMLGYISAYLFAKDTPALPSAIAR